MSRPGVRGQPGSVIALVMAGVLVLSVPSVVVPALAPVAGDATLTQTGTPGNGSNLAGRTVTPPGVPTPQSTPTDVGPPAQSRTATGTNVSHVADRYPELQALRAKLDSDSRLNRTAALAASETVLAARQRTADSGRLQAQLATQRTTLRGARALLEAAGPPDEHDPVSLTTATRLAELGLKMQTAQVHAGTTPTGPTEVSLPTPTTPEHDSPSAAAFAIIDRSNARPTADQATAVRSLDDLPEPTRTELTDVLDAYLGYADATNETTVDLNWTRLRSLQNGPATTERGDHRPGGYTAQAILANTTGLSSPDGGLDARRIRGAQLELLEASAALEDALSTDDSVGLSRPAQHGIAPQNVTVQTGNISIDLTTHDNTYSQNYALQIDFGGNDTYNNNAGGVDYSGQPEAAALLDIHGDDRYNGNNGGGTAVGGPATELPPKPTSGFLLDVHGKDNYTPNVTYGKNGGGSYSGSGFLVDVGVANDTYVAAYGANGGANLIGRGFLLDTGGSDTYQGSSFGSNGGANIAGAGFLMDAGLGEDAYYGGGKGTNGGGFGGVGFLLDTGRGDDRYEAGGRAGGRGSNGGGSVGTGFLVDAGGEDVYETGGSGTNGGGATAGTGFLLDTGIGADSYVAGAGGTNGGGISGGAGFLFDAGIGDTTYDAGDGGTNGGAVSDTIETNRGVTATVPLHSEGLLVDAGGNDAYSAGRSGVNGGAVAPTNLQAPVPARALLYDASGSDSYTDSHGTCWDCVIVPKGTVGAQIDSDSTEVTRDSRKAQPAVEWPMFGGNPARSGHVDTIGPTDGVEVSWQFETDDWVTSSSPAVANGTVYVGSLDGRVYAVDATTGDERWRFTTDAGVRSSPAVVNGTVYVGSSDTRVYALNATSGEQRWNFTTGLSTFGVRSSPTVVDGTVYVGSNDDSLYALDAWTGEERWNFSTSDDVRSSPAVVDGTVYVGSRDNNLYALNTETGALRWNFTTNGRIISAPAVTDGSVYVGTRVSSENGTMYAIDAGTGVERWHVTLDGNVYRSPAVAHETVYVGSDDGRVYALDAQTGTERWQYKTSDPVRSPPAVVDNTVYVGDLDNRVYALTAHNGRPRWIFTPNDSVIFSISAIYSSPAVVNNSLYFGSTDGNVYALTEPMQSGSAAALPTSTPTPTPTESPSPTATPTPTNQPPSIQPTFVTEVNNVGSPVTVTANASDGDGNVSNVSLVWSDGSTVDEVSCDASQCTVGLSTVPANHTWNGTRSEYDSISLTVVARDDTGRQANESVSVRVQIAGDATGDGVVDIFDAVAVGNAWETTRGDADFSDGADLTNDGQVDIFDAVQVGNHWEESASNS